MGKILLLDVNHLIAKFVDPKDIKIFSSLLFLPRNLYNLLLFGHHCIYTKPTVSYRNLVKIFPIFLEPIFKEKNVDQWGITKLIKYNVTYY